MIGIPADKNAKPDDVWKKNFEIVKDCMNEKYGKEIIERLYDYYLEEIGLDKIVNFLKFQDKIEELNGGSFVDYGNFFIENKRISYYKNDNDEDDDEDDKKIIPKKYEYNIEIIKTNLFKYFIQELVEEIPEDAFFQNQEDVIDFIKMYEIKFLYEFLIPVLDLKGKELKN